MSYEQQVRKIDRQLVAFAKEASLTEAASRKLLRSIPGVGHATIEVVLSELANVQRFRSQKPIRAYAGLAPGYRQSAGKSQEVGVEFLRRLALSKPVRHWSVSAHHGQGLGRWLGA